MSMLFFFVNHDISFRSAKMPLHVETKWNRAAWGHLREWNTRVVSFAKVINTVCQCIIYLHFLSLPRVGLVLIRVANSALLPWEQERTRKTLANRECTGNTCQETQIEKTDSILHFVWIWITEIQVELYSMLMYVFFDTRQPGTQAVAYYMLLIKGD